MTFSVDADVIAAYPGITIGVLSIYDMVNTGNVSKIMELLRAEEERQKTILPAEDLGSLPEVSAWREIYRSFGSKPKDYRSSVESLLRRARSSKELPDINPLVNLYNYISLKYHLPAGAEDLDAVQGNIVLTHADGSEKGVALGFDTEEVPDAGEVIYRDDAGFLCRKWNWREAKRTIIHPETKRAVLVIEKAPGLEPGALTAALEEAKVLIEAHLSATCAIMMLDGQRPFCDL